MPMRSDSITNRTRAEHWTFKALMKLSSIKRSKRVWKHGKKKVLRMAREVALWGQYSIRELELSLRQTINLRFKRLRARVYHWVEVCRLMCRWATKMQFWSLNTAKTLNCWWQLRRPCKRNKWKRLVYRTSRLPMPIPPLLLWSRQDVQTALSSNAGLPKTQPEYWTSKTGCVRNEISDWNRT